MPNIIFYIDRSKSKRNRLKLSPIIANITIFNKNHPKVIERVKERYWSKAKQRVLAPRETEPYNRYIEINRLIDIYTNKAKSLFNECLIKDVPITEKIVADFLKGNIISETKNSDIDSIYSEFITEIDGKTSLSTFKKHKTAKTFLTDYQAYAKIKLNVDDIDDAFPAKLFNYAVAEKLKTNTFFTYISSFKNFLIWARMKKYFTEKKHKKFQVKSTNITHLSLTYDELKTLYYFNFDHPKLDQVRDQFCFGCLTGFRTGDIMILKRSHIKERFIEFTLQKTKVQVSVPIVDAAQRIIDKCADPVMLFKKISYSGYLSYLEKCCEIAGINDITEKVSELVNGKEVREQKEKYKLITGHTSRKTFVKLSRSLSVDEDVVKFITGHKGSQGDKIFSKYNNVNKNLALKQMTEAWKVLYQAPGTENKELTELEKAMKKIKELEKTIELLNTDNKGTLAE